MEVAKSDPGLITGQTCFPDITMEAAGTDGASATSCSPLRGTWTLQEAGVAGVRVPRQPPPTSTSTRQVPHQMSMAAAVAVIGKKQTIAKSSLRTGAGLPYPKVQKWDS